MLHGSIASNLHFKKIAWQQHIKNRFSRTWEEVKSLLTRLSRRDMMVASSRTGSGREVEETRRLVFGLSFAVQLLMELDLVSERKRITWHF